MEKVLKGKIYDIQEFSVHDGPGIRTTVFLKGCPLRCPWCHSPESQSFYTQMSYIPLKCIGTELCGECLKVCPSGAASVGESTYSASYKKDITLAKWSRADCLQCLKCTEVCFPEALAAVGKDYTVEEVTGKLRKSYDYFISAGGGVTVSGGEPLSQIDFTEALLKAIKEDSIHTALDTTFFAPCGSVERVLPYTDLFLLDLKHMDNDRHKEVVGVPNDVIHANALWAAEHGARFQIRIPVIPDFNDSEENLNRTAEFCLKIRDSIECVQLLPFHHYGASKYDRIQMYDPIPADMKPPSDEKMEEYRSLFEGYGLNAIIH